MPKTITASFQEVHIVLVLAGGLLVDRLAKLASQAHMFDLRLKKNNVISYLSSFEIKDSFCVTHQGLEHRGFVETCNSVFNLV